MSQLKMMRTKLVRIMLMISGLTGVATFATVAMISVQNSTRHLATVQKHIEGGIASKGRVLTRNHALALRNLTLDNAFMDIQRLVEGAVREDEDLVYGLFVTSDHQTLALSRRDIESDAAEEDAGPLARDAWRELGLVEAELVSPRQSVRRVERLGRDLLEVAVPVTDEAGQHLGTLRYALSTRPMHEALARAQTEKSADLLRSVLWIAALVALTTTMGWLLSRLQAFRITRPVADLTQAAHALASGNRSVRVSITSGDELELLGSSFNHMVAELDASYRELERMNRTLEQKVEARTLELALKNRDMRLVLDNVDQAFLMLSPDGRVTGARSRVVSEWFGECPDQTELATFIGRTSPAFGMAFDCGWSQVVDAILPLELTMDQLPARLAASGRTWSFRYLPLVEAGKLEALLVVAAEITERLAREREEAEQRELMQCFTRLMRDRRGFLHFVAEADRMVGSICASLEAEQLTSAKVALHTLKGSAASMGLSVIASLCHLLEEQLHTDHGASKDRLRSLTERWRTLREHVLELVPSESQGTLEVAASDYEALLARLAPDPSQAELLAEIRGWSFEPAARPLERLAEEARVLARRLGKGQLQVVVRAEAARLHPESWRPFFTELVHLIRNAVDHGIEEPSERQRRGKSPGGQLVLAARVDGEALTFEVSDDGRGVDWDLIRKRAASLGLAHSTPAELVRVLCHPGVSTRGEVSDTSGRGVGMTAFERCVRRMRGSLEVESSVLGTRWLIRFEAGESAFSKEDALASRGRSWSGRELRIVAS